MMRLAVVAALLLVGSSTRGAGLTGHAQELTIAGVLARAGEYSLAYEKRFSMLVAEEHYVQRSERPGAASAPPTRGNPITALPGRASRTLRSDFLLVRSDTGGWMPYRDVFEVDGRQVRDREDRMVKLLLNPSASSMERAQRIMNESTRYNLGRVTRTINVPTLGILIVQPGTRDRFRIEKKGEETVGGRTAWVVSLDEQMRPTLVHTTDGRDLPMVGELWIEPSTGTVVKTMMTLTDTNVRGSVIVTYREDPALELWVPGEMVEHYRTFGSVDEIRCTATYSNYRRFSVSTGEVIQKPATKPPGS
jgi:hypothetical protein